MGDTVGGTLDGKSPGRICSYDERRSADYGKVKEVVLHQYDVNEEMHRQ